MTGAPSPRAGDHLADPGLPAQPGQLVFLPPAPVAPPSASPREGEGGSWRDITVAVRPGMPLYSGDPEVRFDPHFAIERGDAANVTRLSFGTHTGTHVDAPRHFLPEGAPVDALPLDALVGEALVVDGEDLDLARIPAGTERLLLKTQGPLSPEAARGLAGSGVKLVGIEGLSVDPVGADRFPAHHALLGAGVVIVEGLDLRDEPPGAYDLVVLPLKLAGLDGAPARAILRRRS